MDQCSLPDTFSGPHAQDKEADIAVEARSIPMDEWALLVGIAFPSFDTGTPQSRELSCELFVTRMQVTAHADKTWHSGDNAS